MSAQEICRLFFLSTRVPFVRAAAACNIGVESQVLIHPVMTLLKPIHDYCRLRHIAYGWTLKCTGERTSKVVVAVGNDREIA